MTIGIPGSSPVRNACTIRWKIRNICRIRFTSVCFFLRCEEQIFYAVPPYSISMTEAKGHFENGRWVEYREPEPAQEPGPEPGPGGARIDDLAGEASQSVRKAIDDVVRLGHNLFFTPEGRDHIERTAKKAGGDLERTIDEMVKSARKSMRDRK
jgi:hypothetical protein